jgi:transcriptional regulator of acetoin/glycerol metabolism
MCVPRPSDVRSLPLPALAFPTFKEAQDAAEKTYLLALLERHRWNISAAARTAEMDRVYLHRLVKYHGLQRPGSQLVSSPDIAA